MKSIINKTITGIIAIIKGMLTIMMHFFRNPITGEYPEVKPEFNSRYRGRLALLTDNEGNDLCIGCLACTKVCPCGDLIQIEAVKDPETKKNMIKQFTIDIGRCIFCGNCTEICPTGAIRMTEIFELADYTRESLVFDKEALTLSTQNSEKLINKRESELK